MLLNNFISLPHFLISFFIGLLITYLITPFPEIIIKYPTPETANNITYKDKADTCYKYKSTEVSCEKNKIEPSPLQSKK